MTYHSIFMKILVNLTTSKYGSIVPPCSLKKLTWISTSVRNLQEPQGDEDKDIAKRIITDFIKYHLIPNVSSLKSPKGIVRCYRIRIRHCEWPPRIMGFIHSRNVCQKKVITFNRLQEECTQEEARLMIREEKMMKLKEGVYP